MWFSRMECPFLVVPIIAAFALAATGLAGRAQAQVSTTGMPGMSGGMKTVTGLAGIVDTGHLDIYVNGPNGAPLTGVAMVTLTKASGQIYRQETIRAGHIRLDDIGATEYKLQVVAPGYEPMVKDVEFRGSVEKTVTFELRSADVEDTGLGERLAALGPKAQKELGKATEALRDKNTKEARSHLEAAYKLAAAHPDVNYTYGVYESELNRATEAKTYWKKALEADPNHLRTLLSLSDTLLHETKGAEALPYLTRALKVQPTSWRAHALMATAQLQLGAAAQSVQEAQRALELGHDKADVVKPVLAAALTQQNDKPQAIQVLEGYIKDHPSDTDARKELANILMPTTVIAATVAGDESDTLLPSSWMPPDIDESVPPVETGAVCSLKDVLAKAGDRMQEFVKNTNRFTATETLIHESINKWGLPANTERRKYDYVASVSEVAPGFLGVDEFRNTANPADQAFPDGVETNGLPALALIFHPYNAKNFDMTCEGLAKWNGGLAWQVHFVQAKGKPNNIRNYKSGVNGIIYPVALKGRAWIAADTYQVVRLETELAAPLPQIRLLADRTEIDYGPVKFRDKDVQMWLPQSAEIFYYWKGRRIHRRHSFSNYLLFDVNDQQKISNPKGAEGEEPEPAAKPGKPNN